MEGGKGMGPTAIAALLFSFFFFFFFLRNAAATEIRLRDLKEGFYSSTCPQAEDIVRAVVARYFSDDPTIPAGLLRLHFHDCFVRGCDASILLDSTPTGEPTEKSSLANGNTLRGLDLIDEAKLLLESKCPSTVSCADILAFAARDGAALAGLPPYPVPSGRRDGRVSLASNIPFNLPSPDYTVPHLSAVFAKKGFNQTEMVVLSGAHSIGGAHCFTFSHRVYNYKPGIEVDPSLEEGLAGVIRMVCPNGGGEGKVAFVSETAVRLNGKKYYEGLEKGRGLLRSDQALMQNKKTREVVRRMARDPSLWAEEFGKAMVKVGAVDVLVGEEGEVRRMCRSVNL